MERDFFSVLQVPRRFEQDLAALERRYYELSRELHPDRHARAGASALQASVEGMSFLNEAYRTLKDPHERRRYLLLLEGVPVPEGKGSQAQIPMELTEAWFELQDALTENPEAAATALREFESRLKDEESAGDAELSRLEREYDAKAEDPLSRKILDSIARSIQVKSYLVSMKKDVERIRSQIGFKASSQSSNPSSIKTSH